VLSISKCGSVSYYLDLAQGDYYLRGGEPPGEWLGRGAGARDLSGEVDRESFEALARGFDPKTRKALVQNAGSDRRQMGWDLTFSAPKSVSVAWALSERDVRQGIQEAQARAVRAAASFLESEAGLSRAGSQGADVQRALWTAAAFEHGTSRAQDPQLHTHVVLLNLGLCPDGKTRALKTEELFQLKMTAGAVYRAELARELEQLGFAVERHSHHDPEKRRTHSWFELTAVPWEAIEHFSKRRDQVLKALSGFETKSAAAAKIATLVTRSKKEHLPRGENLDRWKAEARELGIDPSTPFHEAHRPKRSEKQDLAQLLTRVHDRLSLRPSFTERDLIRRLAIEAQDHGKLSGTTCIAAAKRALARDRRFARAGERGGEKLYTTVAYQKAERKLSDALKRAEKERAFRIPGRDIDREASRRDLSESDRNALRQATTRGRVSTVESLSDDAIGAARDSYRRFGYRVLAVSSTKKRAEELEEALGEKSDTVARLLWEHRKEKPSLTIAKPGSLVATLVHGRPASPDRKAPAVRIPLPSLARGKAREFERGHLPEGWQTTAMQAAGVMSTGKKRYLDWQRGRQHLALDRQTVILVDGADRLRAQDMGALMDLARENRAKLILADRFRHVRHQERDVEPQPDTPDLYERLEEERLLREQERQEKQPEQTPTRGIG